MPASVGLSRDQMFRSQILLGIIKEFEAPGTDFQRFYGLGVGATPMKRVMGRTGTYDIVNPVRNMANPRSPSLPTPLQIQKRVIGSIPFTCMRFHEAVTLYDEDYMLLRAPGGQVGTIDASGQRHIALEVDQLTSRNRTAREFMATRMFMGGWGVQSAGDRDWLVEKGASNPTCEIDTRVPALHTGTGPIGSDGSTPIFTTKWDDPDCDIIGQFAELDLYSARVHGSKIRHIWQNSSMYSAMLNITQLREVRGTANIVFDRYANNTQIPEGNRLPDTGFDVTFAALPGRVFHFYNQGYVAEGTAGNQSEQISASNWTPFIANNRAIMTPNPGPWCGTIAGHERIYKRIHTRTAADVYGFDIWADETLNRPGKEVKALDNMMLALLEPYAVYYITTGT